MKNMMNVGEEYIKKMDVVDVGLLKISLFSMGLLSGICVRKRDKKIVRFWATIISIGTLYPLLCKFLRIYKEQE